MLNRFFGENTHTYLHVLGLSGIAFGLPWSKVVMSISVMFIVLNVLLEADFKDYLKNFKSNRVYWLVVTVYFLHIIGIAWSTNISEALHDVKQQLPFIAIPTILVAKPILNRKHIDLILIAFLAPMLFTSLYNFFSYQQWLGPHVYDDIRGLSLTTSHVRYGLLISMAAAICLHFVLRNTRKWIIPCLVLLGWFAFYTVYSQVISGVLSFGAMIAVFLIYSLWFRSKIIAGSLALVLGLMAFVPIIWLLQPMKFDAKKYSNLPTHTALGNPYEHNFTYISSETCEPVLIYLCEEELEDAWNKRSSIAYDASNIQGDAVGHTLIRYLTSLKLTRDAAGMKQLTDTDIKNIELGRTSRNHSGLMPRMHSLRFQLNYAINPNGHSLLQRFEYWKTGIQILRENWLVGVGNGDVQEAFNEKYVENNSALTEKNRRRTHNQFLSYWIAFGVIGFILFSLCIVSFIVINAKRQQLLALLFITIISVSFFMEDTLETQTGVTFFALFYGLFLTNISPRKSEAATANS